MDQFRCSWYSNSMETKGQKNDSLPYINEKSVGSGWSVETTGGGGAVADGGWRKGGWQRQAQTKAAGQGFGWIRGEGEAEEFSSLSLFF